MPACAGEAQGVDLRPDAPHGAGMNGVAGLTSIGIFFVIGIGWHGIGICNVDVDTNSNEADWGGNRKGDPLPWFSPVVVGLGQSLGRYPLYRAGGTSPPAALSG